MFMKYYKFIQKGSQNQGKHFMEIYPMAFKKKVQGCSFNKEKIKFTKRSKT